MKILTIGDVVSQQGCDYLLKELPKLKREFKADVTVVNGENSAIGNGILPQSADILFNAGADVITLGNHSFQRREIYNYLNEHPFIIRPANFHESAPGSGIAYVDKGHTIVAVINLQGAVYLNTIRNPFDVVDDLIEEAKGHGAKIIVIDFHAEATGEKKAFGYYLDGKVSAVFGTHTHVQTSDNQILPLGTGYISDIGMTGPYYSVLGVEPKYAIEKMRTGMPVHFKSQDGPCTMEGCLFEIDNKTGKTTATEIFRV